MTAVAEAKGDEQVVVVRMDAERYGVDVFRVNEIIRLREITPVSQAARHIRGLVNLRGKTIPVVDLRVRLGIGDMVETAKARMIVVQGEGGQIGMVVDEVCEVVALPGASIEWSPGHASYDCVRGVALRDDRLIALLDLDRILEA